MSGIGFQKLNGEGTSAYDLLQKTIELVEEIQKLNYPDIYKMAKMFAPNLQLVAVTKNWLLDFGDGNRELNFDGRYFGYFVLSAGTTETANNDNGYRLCQGRVYDANETTALVMAGYHGDDILPMNSESVSYTGFGTSMYFGALKGIAKGYCNVSFIGFKLGDAVVSPPLPEEPIIVTVNNSSQKQVNVAYVDISNVNKTILVEPAQTLPLECKKSKVVKLDFAGALLVDNTQQVLTASKTFNASGVLNIAPPPNHNLSISNHSDSIVTVTFKGVPHEVPANSGFEPYTLEVNADEDVFYSFDANLVVAGEFSRSSAKARIYHRADVAITNVVMLEVRNPNFYQLNVDFLANGNSLSFSSSNFSSFNPVDEVSHLTTHVKITSEIQFQYFNQRMSQQEIAQEDFENSGLYGLLILKEDFVSQTQLLQTLTIE